jgi:butyrate kinase
MIREGAERILVVNPGSTSTKVAVFDGDVCLVEGSLPPPVRETGEAIWEELPDRLDSIRAWLAGEAIPLWSMEAVAGRGGLLKPLSGGTYEVTEEMLADARSELQGAHPSNLGCALARALADLVSEERKLPGGGEGPLQSGGPRRPAVRGTGQRETSGVPAFVVDPVSTDEFGPLARYSGLKEIQRKSLSHALSIHAVTRQACRSRGQPLVDSAFVVTHLGGGISVCPVQGGRILDSNNANSGGPFSPSRAGGLPVQELLDLAFSEGSSRGLLRFKTLKEGGLVSYLGTDDAREVEARIAQGDNLAREVYEAMAYQIAKEIGAMATVLKGHVDAILMTGGLASSRLLVDWVRDRVAFIGPVEVIPEIEEMRALAQGVLRILRGEEKAGIY